MYKINILTFLLLLVVSLAALAQSQTIEDTGIDLGRFKTTNLQLGISNDSFGKDFFAGEVWNNYLKSGLVNAFAKSNKLDAKTCKFVTKVESHFIQCDGVDTDVTKKFNESKEKFEISYANGAEAYAAEKDIKKINEPVLTEVTPLENKVTPPVTPIYTSGPYGQEFWDSQMQGTLVVLEETEQEKLMNRYKWTNPTTDLTDKYWNPNDSYVPIKMSTNTDPIVNTSPLIILPVDKIVTDNTIVINDSQIITNPIVKLDEEKKDDKIKDDGKVDELIVNEEKKTDCKDELNLEIAKLLTDDTKNIIGLQFELTILKMAAAAIGAKTNTLEGLIKQQSKAIASIDTGIIDQMNVMYKAHGLAEDAASITEHLKVRSAEATYAKDKRFFNQDSSAFLLAYQKLNPDSGIKDSDISVLWFMEKVSTKAQAQNGKYQIQHNLTNLSTRIAQYTGYIKAPKKYEKDDLDEMVKKQKSKMDTEFLALIEDFKKNNLPCYNEIFGEGEDDCNVGQVEAVFSELLAIRSKISATDSVSLDAKLNGEVNGAKFKISKYVD